MTRGVQRRRTCRRAAWLAAAPILLVTAGIPMAVTHADVVPKPALPPPDCPAGMAAIAGGSYTMAVRGDAVTVSRYCLDLTEVTVTAFASCVTSGACTAPKAYVNKSGDWHQLCNWKHPEGRGTHPINCVDFAQAETYCAAQKKRLPTEEEWEWAARSGEKGWRYPWGDVAPDATLVNACGKECPPNAKAKGLGAWSTMYAGDDGYPETAPVGSFPKGDNRFGVHDLAGNVWEWTSGWHGATKSSRAVRGGAFDYDAASFLLAGHRFAVSPTDQYGYLGFRCARTP